MRLGYLGLGRMGLNMVLRLLEKRHEVVVWNRSSEPRQKAAKAGAEAAETLEDLVSNLSQPRAVWLMFPAGDVTEGHINLLADKLSAGDLIIDGANSFYKDTMRRARLLEKRGIRFMDVGVSGGPEGARNGACLMVGGEKEDFQEMESLLKDIAAPDAYRYLGPAGAGHFVKMVHNGIEYGMMQAIGEGFAVMKHSVDFDLDLAKVADVYNHKSVIESRLIGWAKAALEQYPELSEISDTISHTGEGEWTIQTAKELGIPVPIIEASFQVRVRSEKEVRENPKVSFRNKMVSALRGQFGGHAVKKA